MSDEAETILVLLPLLALPVYITPMDVWTRITGSEYDHSEAGSS